MEFEVNGGTEAECAMGALAVVEAFDVIEDGVAGLTARGKGAAVDEEARLSQGVAVSSAGVLDAAIGVAEQLGGWMTMQEGHGQSF